MSDGIVPSTLKFLGRPNKAILNLLKGNVEGAARQALSGAGDAIDWLLPGDWIPDITREEDNPEFSDVIGGMEPGFGKTAVDILGGMATDPLTYVGVGPLVKGAKAAGELALKGATKVAPELTAQAVKGAKKVGDEVRAATGNLKVSEPLANTLAEAGGKGSATSKAAQGFAVPAFQGVDPEIQAKTIGIIRGVMDDAGTYKALDAAGETAIPFVTKQEQMARIEQRLAQTPWDDATKQAVRETADKVTDYTRGAYGQLTKDSVLARPELWHSPEGKILAQHLVDGEFQKVAADAQRVLDSKVASLEEKLAAREAKAQALKPVGELIDRRAGDVLGAMPPEGAFQPRNVGRAEGYNEIGNSVEGRLGTVTSQADALRQELELAKMAQKGKLGVPASLEDYAKGKGYIKKPIAEDLAPADYLPGKYDVDEKAAEALGLAGSPNLIKAKSLRAPEDLASFLNTNKAKLETDLPSILGDYGAQMGRATEAAAIGKKLAPDAFKALSDDKSRAAIRDLIKTMREAGKADDAVALETAFQGLPPREGFWKLMAGLNTLFKPAATSGAGIPKPGFNVRNALSGAVSIGMDDGLGAGLSALARTPKILAGGFGDGLRKLGLPIPHDARLAQIDEAIRASGGSRDKMLSAISDPTVKMAVELGVIDNGFVSSEKMAEAIANAGPKNWKTWRDWPSEITKGVEQRMRLGRFDEAVNKLKMSPAEAAKVTSGNLYDYAYSSVMNRKIRDIIPFAQYSFKAIPQSAKFLTSGTPLANATLSGMTHLSSVTDDNQVYPWMEGRLNIPLGANDQGDNNFISGLGLPMESLAQIPNLSGSPRSIGREIERNVVASTQPLLKSTYSLLAGHDPFSQQPTMAYDKIPVIGKAGEAGRMYNLAAGTGLLQPIDSPIRTVDKLLDSRRDLLTRALDVGTGANVVSVDPNRAQQMQISAELEQNPQVSQYRSFYQGGVKDPEIQAKLDAMKAAGKAARAEAAGPKKMFKKHRDLGGTGGIPGQPASPF
jgi:hypothetical protein